MTNGRDIVPSINELLSLPFVLKIATKDWHLADHVSFAANHPYAEPYTSMTTITNPLNSKETYETRLWPVHCVQGTPGAELIPELDTKQLDMIVEKGQDSRVEMYSAFYDPLKDPRISDSGLADLLNENGITDAFIVGLAADYCVRSTALDAHAEGFKTWIVEEGTRPVDPAGWDQCKLYIEEKGVKVVRMAEAEVKKVKALSSQ